MKKNSNLAKLNNSANNINNNVRKVVENEIVINIIRVALILYSSFVVPMMSQKQLNLANNQVVRLVVLALVVYLAFMDIVTAALLLVGFLVTLHHSKNSSNNGNNNNQIVNDVQGQNIMNKINNALRANVENYEGHAPAENNLENQVVNNELGNGNVNVNVLADNGNEVNGPNNTELANKLENDYVKSYESVEDPNNVPIGYDRESVISNVNNSKDNNIKDNNIQVNQNILNQPNVNNMNSGNNNKVLNNEEVNNMIMNQPASETLTDSILRAQGAEQNVNDPMGLTTGQNLYDASENAVPSSNILDQVKTVKNQLSAQGMDYPFGAGAKRYDGYHYDDTHISHAMLRNEQTNQ